MEAGLILLGLIAIIASLCVLAWAVGEFIDVTQELHEARGFLLDDQE